MLKSICQIIQQRITRQTMQTGTESTAIFTTDKWIAWEKMSSCSLSLSFSIYLPHSLPSAPNLSPSHIFTKLHGHTENHIVASSSRNPSLELKHFSKSFPASFSFHLMHFCRAKRLTEIKTIGSKFASRPTLSISKRTIGIYMCLVTQSCPVLCDPMDYSPPSSSGHRDSPSKNTGVGWHALFQGIFPIQRSNSGLLYCRQNFFFFLPSELPWKLGLYINRTNLCACWKSRGRAYLENQMTQLVFMLPQCSFLLGRSNKVLWVGWLIASGKSLLSQIWRLCGAIHSKPVFHLLVAARNPQHSLACGYIIPFSASNYHMVSSLRICL